jgi:4-amino-4-deoxychorismate lyase
MVHPFYIFAKWCNAPTSFGYQKIKETEITLQNIKEFTHFQLINSMNDFDDMFIYPIERIVNLPESREYLGI